MPIYEWKCDKCGLKDEHIMSWERAQSVEVVCQKCSLAMTRIVSLVAKTPMGWHGNWSEGMSHTYFSKALGRQVANAREEAKIMQSRGFVNERDLPQHWFADNQSKIIEKRAQQDALSDTYASKIKEGLTPAQAITETFTAEKCLSGELDKVWDDKISTT